MSKEDTLKEDTQKEDTQNEDTQKYSTCFNEREDKEEATESE